MGTQGKKPENKITISKGDANRQVIKANGNVDRSIAQPNPALPQEEIKPKAHASEDEKARALTENSTRGRDYQDQDDGEKQD